jgi:hypothetical protein
MKRIYKLLATTRNKMKKLKGSTADPRVLKKHLSMPMFPKLYLTKGSDDA